MDFHFLFFSLSCFLFVVDKDSPLTPDEAYNKLKELLAHISEASFEYPLLRCTQMKQLDMFIREAPSYEHLLANSIVNQVMQLFGNFFCEFLFWFLI